MPIIVRILVFYIFGTTFTNLCGLYQDVFFEKKKCIKKETQWVEQNSEGEQCLDPTFFTENPPEFLSGKKQMTAEFFFFVDCQIVQE